MSNDRATALAFTANKLFAFQIASALVEKGLLTSEEAGAVMVKTANLIRTGTEDEADERLGESFARQYEDVAGWLLRARRPTDPSQP